MKYLFWNTNKVTSINPYIVELVKGYQPDIFALAEYSDDLMQELIKTLKKLKMRYYEIKRIGSRLWIFTKIPCRNVKHGPDDTHYTVKIFPYNDKEKQIIVFLHLPSKLHDDENCRRDIIHKINDSVHTLQEKRKINKLVYIGDFNMNPYEDPMITATELHANPSRSIALRKHRNLNGTEFKFLYNPMWNLLGDKELPEGTYYYSSPKYTSEYWNIFDQFLVSPELIDDVDISKIEIVTNIGDKSLSNKSNRPNVSDHFPLYFQIGG